METRFKIKYSKNIFYDIGPAKYFPPKVLSQRFTEETSKQKKFKPVAILN